MANVLITPTIIAKEALFQLENNLVMGNLVHREYKKEFVKVGATVQIRKPVKFKVHSGADITTGAINEVKESYIDFTIDKQYNVSWQFASDDLTLTIEQYSERYIKPAMIVLANQVDAHLCGLYADVWNCAGTAGATPATFAALGSAAQKLDEFAVPRDERVLVLDPAANWAIADGLKGLYDTQMIREFVKKGRLTQIAGMDIYMDQNIVKHTHTTLGGTIVTDTVGGVEHITTLGTDDTCTIHTDGWTGDLVVGDVFTIAGVNSVNPVSKQDTGSLQQFVVKTAFTGTTDSPIVVSPAIVTAADPAAAFAPYQTVTAIPDVEAAITMVASNTSNLAFHKNAFGLVTVPMELPDGAAFKARESHNGLSVRIIKGYDILLDTETIRIDLLYGVKTIYPELATRLLG